MMNVASTYSVFIIKKYIVQYVHVTVLCDVQVKKFVTLKKCSDSPWNIPYSFSSG